MLDLIIIGGGPAGITAGIYAARKKIKTLVLAKNFVGQAGLTGIIENWPGEKQISGLQLMAKFKNHLREYDVAIKESEALALRKKDHFIVETKDEQFAAAAVIVATGRKQRSLMVDGEQEFVGKGVVYCATCDAPLFGGKRVAVAGGGNAGFESAIELADYAKEVFLFEAGSSFMADEVLREKAQNRGVKMFTRRKITKIKGDKFLRSISFDDSGEEKTMEVDGLFVQIGSIPASDFVKNLVDLSPAGEIQTDSFSGATKTAGLFAAGDVTNVKNKQIVIAAGEGAKAALSVYDYLKS